MVCGEILINKQRKKLFDTSVTLLLLLSSFPPSHKIGNGTSLQKWWNDVSIDALMLFLITDEHNYFISQSTASKFFC